MLNIAFCDQLKGGSGTQKLFVIGEKELGGMEEPSVIGKKEGVDQRCFL